MVYAEGPVNNCSTKTFSQLFVVGMNNGTNLPNLLGKGLVNKKNTYVFELMSPENRIVTRYVDTSIALLTIRNKETLDEEVREDVEITANIFGCKLVEAVPLSSWEAVLDMEALDPTFEGYVVVKEQASGSHLRVKCKNPRYLAISKMVSSVSEKGFLEVIKLGNVDETLAYFPEYKGHIQKLLDGLDKVEYTIRNDWAKMPQLNLSQEAKKNRKEFAIAAYKTKFPNMLFALYDNKTCLYNLKTYLIELRDDTLLDMIHQVTE
jgi:hypothetical protein